MRTLIRRRWLRLWARWVDFSAHYTWHLTQPEMYKTYVAQCPGDFIECPWCHERWEC